MKGTPASPDHEYISDGKYASSETKTGHNGVILVPRPSDDTRDPLVCIQYRIYLRKLCPAELQS